MTDVSEILLVEITGVWNEFPAFVENYLVVFLLFAFPLFVWGVVNWFFSYLRGL